MIETRIHVSPTVRVVLWSIGTLALLLGVIGVFLPLLPTTPFILLATLCYSRASPRFHQMILNSKLFGPLIVQWHQSRTIPRAAKQVGLVMTGVSIGISIAVLSGRPTLQIFLAVLGLGLGGWLASIPTGGGERSP